MKQIGVDNSRKLSPSVGLIRQEKVSVLEGHLIKPAATSRIHVLEARLEAIPEPEAAALLLLGGAPNNCITPPSLLTAQVGKALYLSWANVCLPSLKTNTRSHSWQPLHFKERLTDLFEH